MPSFRLPPGSTYNARTGASTNDPSSGVAGFGIAGVMIAGKPATVSYKDGGMINCLIQTVTALGKKLLYCVKRPGWEQHTIPAAGKIGHALLIWTGNGNGDKVVSAFGTTSTAAATIYDGTTSLGAISAGCTSLTETIVGATVSTIVMSSTDNTAWYMSSDATSAGFTGNRTSGSAVISAIASTTGLYAGQAIVGTGFAAGTRILTVDSATQVTATNNASSGAPTSTVFTNEKLAKIIDVDFPGNASLSLAGGFVHMDGFAAIMDTNGKLWASDLNTLTGWTATSFDSANAYPDKGIGAIRHRNTVMCFGTESIQFFYNAGLTPFPFSKSVAQTIKIGAVNANAITSISDTVAFAGSTPQGGISIFQWDGQLSRISTPELDAILVLNGSTGLSLTSVRFFGRSFFLVNTGTFTLAYCIEEKLWHEWGSVAKLWYKCVGASLGATLPNYCLSNTVTGGKVYKMNPNAFVYTDDGAAISWKLNLPNEDFGTARKKFISDLELISDIEAVESLVDISITWDDFKSFTALGTVDLSNDRPRITRCGSGRKFGLQLTGSSNTKMRLEALEGQFEMGSS